MNYQHQGLSAERWAALSLHQRMANIGSEVGRALSWRAKGNEEYSRLAFYRSLELLDLSLNTDRQPAHLKELARLRECLVDFFAGDNQYCSSAALWNKYFYPFNFAAASSA